MTESWRESDLQTRIEHSPQVRRNPQRTIGYARKRESLFPTTEMVNEHFDCLSVEA